MPFGQLVIGPPGSGKSTYCNGMHQFLSAIGRKCSIVNLDPANERTSYPCALDIRSLITLEEVMEEEGLGPNGGVLYALEALEKQRGWLEEGLRALGEDYVLFDCPGQVEVFTHHGSLRNVFLRIQRRGYRVRLSFPFAFYPSPGFSPPPAQTRWPLKEEEADIRYRNQLVALHLTDSYSLTLPSLYISTLLLSLRAMLQMDLPHLNVLTKIDNLASYGPLPFPLVFYTEVHDLSYLLPHLAAEHPTTTSRHANFDGLNRAVIELVEEFGLVAFETLAVEDKRSMMTLLQAVDRAGGYAFGGAEGANDTVWQVAMREGMKGLTVQDVQERWIDRKEEFDEVERVEMEAARKEAEAEAAPSVGGTGGQFDDVDGLGEEWGPGSGTTVVRRS